MRHGVFCCQSSILRRPRRTTARKYRAIFYKMEKIVTENAMMSNRSAQAELTSPEPPIQLSPLDQQASLDSDEQMGKPSSPTRQTARGRMPLFRR
jgi:hypothetical protein